MFIGSTSSHSLQDEESDDQSDDFTQTNNASGASSSSPSHRPSPLCQKLSVQPKNTRGSTRLSSSSLIIKKKDTVSKSRSEKRRNATLRSGASDVYQTFIPNYFQVLDEISALSKKNSALRAKLKEMATQFQNQRDMFFSNSAEKIEPNIILKRMMDQAIAQSSKRKRGRRYKDHVLLDFSLNIWILGGRHTYEILHDNLPGVFPSPTTIQRKLSKYNRASEPGIVT